MVIIIQFISLHFFSIIYLILRFEWKCFATAVITQTDMALATRECWFIFLLVIFCTNQQAGAKKTLSITFGGDVTFASILKYTVQHDQCTYNESLAQIKKYFTSDVVMVNHEMVYQHSNEINIAASAATFTHLIADAKSVEALKFAGIKYVTLANNHILDLKESGINFTTDLLRQNGIHYNGITHGKTFSRQKPIIIEKNGVKVGILSYCALKVCEEARKNVNAGPAIYEEKLVLKDIKHLRKIGCHAVVVYMHWDTEYTSVMDITTIQRIKFILHNAPVDLILGAHPHTTHDHFYINKTLVASSLGNLLFHSHYAGSLNFNKADHNFTDSRLRTYETLWVKMSKLMKNPSQYGRLLRVTFDKDGVVPTETTYLPTQVFPTGSRDCLVVDKEEGRDWEVVCTDGDPECLGTRYCNIMECEGYDTFPELTVPGRL